ncbi:MAG: hypothetical protein PF541_14915 [Prolixibacteraceae bacterium]|jgi:hypothetical protein|nr:hypothetical protein [Prolixibacteraceae bacterium]
MIRLKITILFSLLLCFGIQIKAQEAPTKTSLQFYGFIRNEFFVDTYKGIDGAHEQYYLLPVYVGKDANGDDINQQTSANMTALASRMGVNITGPEIFGAKSTANIEYDFGGIVASEPTLFRIRKAYVALKWEQSSVLMGQTWHPFWSGDIFPTVASLNTGAPFQPFNRSPQLRYDYKTGNFKLTGAALYQLQYVSPDMIEGRSHQQTSTQAKRNAVLPEFVGNIEFRKESIVVGAGISHNLTKPKMKITNDAGEVYNAKETLTSMSYIGYIQYKKDKLKLQVKSVYGQNLKHLLMAGGYGIASRNGATGIETYTNYTNLTAYLNMVYGKKWQVGLLAGYGLNMGTQEALADMGGGAAKTTGLFTNAQNFYRIAPHVALNVSKLRMVLEYERTSANYGVGGFNLSDGLYSETHTATNNRVVFMMMYFF